MTEHLPYCPRAQFWDAGEWEAPCECYPPEDFSAPALAEVNVDITDLPPPNEEVEFITRDE